MRRVRYFDTSFLIPLVMHEAASGPVIDYFRATEGEDQATSVWAKVEFASALGIRVRHKLLTEDEALDAEQGFAELLVSFQLLPVEPPDFEVAGQMLRDRSLGVRGGDALHLAIARNRDALTMLTLDKAMLRAAARAGVSAGTGTPIQGYKSTST